MKTGEWDVRIDGQSKWGNPFRIGRTVALLLFTPDDAILTAIL